MSPETATLIQTFAGVASILVAIAALWVAIKSEKRSQDQFNQRIELEKEVVRAQFRPILIVNHSRSKNIHHIKVFNRGNGPAKVKSISIEKDGRMAERFMKELFSIPENEAINWGTSRKIGKKVSYIQPGNSITLAEIYIKDIEVNKQIEKEAYQIIESFNKQASGIKITIKYEDFLGNKMPVHTKTLGVKKKRK